MKMKTLILGLATIPLLVAGAASAQSGAEVVKAQGCLNCHDASAQKIGPSFKEIASKNKSAAPLVAKLKEGKGHMKVAASDAELSAAIQYVLSAR